MKIVRKGKKSRKDIQLVFINELINDLELRGNLSFADSLLAK